MIKGAAIFGEVKRRLLENDWKKTFVILLPCLVLLVVLLIFSRGFIILGGEGNYITNFQLIREVGSHAWVPHIHGIGFPGFSLNTLGGIYDFFAFLQQVGFSIKVINITSIWLVYTLPFLAMLFLLRRVMKVSFLAAYTISLFYILNPFSAYHLQGAMFWNVSPFFVLPLVFACLHRFYFEPFKLFLFFGVLTSFLSFSFSNIPYLGVFHIFLVIAVIILPFLLRAQWEMSRVLSNILIAELSFVLFNAWWFLNLVRFQMQDLSLYYTKAFALDWVSEYSTGVNAIMGKLFSLTTLISSGSGNYFSDFYHSPLVIILLFFPFLFVTLNFLRQTARSSGPDKKTALALVAAFLFVVFLNKGASEPLGSIYIWMLEHVPFFYIFKSPLEKFSILSVFLLALALVPVFRQLKSRWLYTAFFLYLFVCSIPFFTLNFMPDHKLDSVKGGQSEQYISRLFLLKKEAINAAESLNEDKLNYRILSLPGSANYQTTILNHDGNKFYRGMDPFIFSVNKPFITAYFDPEGGFFDPLFNNLSSEWSDELLNLYSIKKIVYNHDMYPAFGGFREEAHLEGRLPDVLSKKYEKESFHSLDIFNRKEFLPRFYLSDTIIFSSETREKLPVVVSAPGYETGSALYFSDQNADLMNERLSGLAKQSREARPSKLPTLEYKKISPVKYRAIIHGANGELPLIFSERFHNGWKVTLGDFQPVKASDLVKSELLARYKVWDGNQGEQAIREELAEYIRQGWVSTLGNGNEKVVKHWKGRDNAREWDYQETSPVDFVSKNLYGTIQNDNLPSGAFYETWFRKPLAEKVDHAMVNGYANSWIINTEALCAERSDPLRQTGTCQRNADGTYDLELVVEFWPQRLYYLGWSISGLTLLFSLVYLGVSRTKRFKEQPGMLDHMGSH